MTEPGIEILVLWKDEYVLEVRIRASNGMFAGQTDAYADHGLDELANTLQGFPASFDDTRTFEIGSFDNQYAGGAGFRFFCVDSLGHAVAEVRLKADSRPWDKQTDSATIFVPVEAAGVDSFVAALGRIGQTVGRSAFLEAVKGR